MTTRRYYKVIRPEHYRTFCEVARLGSFAAAGSAVGLDRTTVWQQVETLERELDVRLFDRGKRQLELSEAGKVLLEIVHPLVTALDTVRDEFLARLDGQEQSIRVAGIPDPELREAAVVFRQQCPRCGVIIHERGSLEAVAMVERGECELANCLYRFDTPGNPVVHFEKVATREAFLVTPKNHPLARKKQLALADLVEHPLILVPQSNPWRKYIEMVFERDELLQKMRVVLDSNSFESHVQSVRLGLGVAIAWLNPRHRAAKDLHHRSLTQFFGVAPQYLVWKKGAHLLPHVRSFVELFKTTCAREK